MTMFFVPIGTSATHIYHSALELSPLSSIVRQLYHHQQHTLSPRVIGIQHSWDQSLNICTSTKPAHAPFTWSPCGQLVASGHYGDVEIRDTRSSELLSTLRPTQSTGSWPIGSLAYSLDGLSLAALFYTSLVIWDIQTGGVAREVKIDYIGNIPLVWSLDGQAVGFIRHRDHTGYTVDIYNISLGVIQSSSAIQSNNIPYLWAHNESFQIMTIGWDGQAYTIDISDVWSTLTKIESFYSDPWGQYDQLWSFSPTTYRISISTHDELQIVDIRSSECLLKGKWDNTSPHCFSSDGSLYAGSHGHGIHIWKYTSGCYTLWRNFQTNRNFYLGFSPISPSIIGSSENGDLRVWHLDDLDNPPIHDGNWPTSVLSHHGTYVATAYWSERTITITNFLPQTPPQFIDTDMGISTLALTGNVLLVLNPGTTKIVAWRLTEEGAVDSSLGGRRAGRSDSIWTISLCGEAKFWIEDQTVVITWGENTIHAYDSQTGQVLNPTQVNLSLSRLHSLSNIKAGWHYPHLRKLVTYDNDCKDEWPLSPTIFQEGWVKDLEGKHRLWVLTEWGVLCRDANWVNDITTLWLIPDPWREPVFIKF